MSEKMKTFLLGEIGKVRMCKRVLKEQTSEDERIPFYKISTFGGQPDTYISLDLFNELVEKYSYPQKGEILISAAGTVGKTVIFDGKPSYFQDSNIVWIENDEKIITNKYLYYFYQTKPWQTTNGSTITRIYNDDLRSIKLTFPESIEIQQKIATVLSALDDKIELNNRINAELEQMAKTLYDYWFVQFDFPDANGKPYKSSGGKMVYDEVLKREVPEGWEVNTLDNCVDIIIDYRGKTPKKLGSDWSTSDNGVIALSAKHVKNGKLLNLQDANKVDESLYEAWMKEKLQYGDILMTSEAPCGEFFYLIGETKFCLSQRLFAIRANTKIVDHSYLYYELSSGNGKSQILGKVSGSTVFGIRQDELRTVNVLVPPRDVQESFSKITIPIYEKIRNNDYQSLELSALRDWLLPMLMNGQVKVETSSTDLSQTEYVKSIAIEPEREYKKQENAHLNQVEREDQRFNLWLSNQGLAVRGEIDVTTLRAIFDAMDDEDK